MVVVVGIGGGTASGKTSVARVAAERLGPRCLLVAHDRYYHPKATMPVPGNFDHPDALDTGMLLRDLGRLRDGQPVDLPAYDFASHDRMPQSRWDHAPARPIVVVEGILVLAIPELRDTFDLRVFVDAPDDLRLVRRIRRDTTERGRSVHDVLDQYERTVRPMHERWVAPSRAHADLVLDGTSPPVHSVAQLLGRLEERW